MKTPMRPPQRPPDEQWEESVRQTASALAYPSTPDVAEQVMVRLTTTQRTRLHPRTRRLQPVWVIGLLLALLIGLLAVPPVRAAILEFLQIGAVRIWLVEPTPVPTSASSGERSSTGPRSTAQPSATPLRSLFDLAGETTLAEAEANAGFAIRLPTYPSDLGPPDGVFYQELGGPVVVLVWLNPEQEDKALFTLHILGERAIAEKGNPPVVITTTVKGNEAAWAEGPYMLAYGQGGQEDWRMRYLVSGRVLIWVEDGLTYRLESDLSLQEAVRMAESLR
jgi:hypothetical protein